MDLRTARKWPSFDGELMASFQGPRLAQASNGSDWCNRRYFSSREQSNLPPLFFSGSAPNAQVRLPVSAADEMQNERHQDHDKKNMNQPARHMKKNPAKTPGNH
jgi:hypothetical protein